MSRKLATILICDNDNVTIFVYLAITRQATIFRLRDIVAFSLKLSQVPSSAKTNMLTYENILKFNKLSFVHSIEYQYAPASVNGTWNKNLNRENNFNLRNADDYILPSGSSKDRTSKTHPSILFRLAWNELDDLKFQFNRKTFQLALKESLLNSQI